MNPDFIKAYYNLSTLTYTDKNKIWLPKLFSKNFLKNKSKNDQFIICFARANILHKKKNYEESSKFLKLANQLKLTLNPSNSNILINKSKELLVESINQENNQKKQPWSLLFFPAKTRSIDREI